MPRYFFELAYRGTAFNGFQIQQDSGITIQGELNHALKTLLKHPIETTTSSRTDAGVHALQNFLHADIEVALPRNTLYSINAILHPDIVLKNVFEVPPQAHSRFDATARKYAYHIHFKKDPFQTGLSYYYPFSLDLTKLHECAKMLKSVTDFMTFSKKNTDVKTTLCHIEQSSWELRNGNQLVYHVKANRFLRGMVKALVGTQLQVGRNRMNLDEFSKRIDAKDCSQADFSPPSEGLFLEEVSYPEHLQAKPIPHK